MIDTVLGLWAMLPDLPPTPTPSTVPTYPVRSNGFAAYIVGGFFALGLLILAMVFISLKPKPAPPEGN